MSSVRQEQVSKTGNQPSARLLVVFHCVFLVMFLIFGLGIARDGLRAIQHRSYTLKYTETTRWAFGPSMGGGWVEDKAAEFNGRDAVVFGVGFLATGIMLLTWAMGLVLSLVGRIGPKAPMIVLRCVGAVALVALTVGCLALFPLWRLHTLPFYLVIATFLLAVTLPIPDTLRKKVFPAAVILVIVVGMTSFPSFPLFAGIFVFLAGSGHVLFLWPALGRRIRGA